jgi:mannose-6-phosphate isomerase-like protein (cupin superfamily)
MTEGSTMNTGATRMLPPNPDLLAPDVSEVRILLSLTGGSMAHFLLPPGETTRAVRHRTVAEIWYVLSGQGEMWRSAGTNEKIVPLSAGTSLTIPVGVSFQFRSFGNEPLAAVAITMPPWPCEDEAEFVAGRWKETIP